MVYFLCKAYDSDRQNCYFAQSLPVRGAWIEIASRAAQQKQRKSLPVRGAWIEIAERKWRWRNWACRSPCGERGLKCKAQRLARLRMGSLPVRGAWIEMAINGTSDYPTDKVAPRAGSVD